MFRTTFESSMTTIVFGNLKFPKFVQLIYKLYIMGLRSRPLRAYLMSTYSLGQFNYLSELQFHVVRRSLCRLPATSRGNTQRQVRQPTCPKTSSSSKRSWKGQNKHTEDGRSQCIDKYNRTSSGSSGSGSHGHGNSSLR